MTRSDKSHASVDDLLAEGLDLYGRNRTAEAIRCWQQALALAPGDQRAIDYLEAAGAEVAPAPSSSHGGVVIELSAAREARAATPPSLSSEALGDAESAAVDRAALEALLHDKRYEEALALLYRARDRTPQDPALSRSIRALKEHLVLCFSRELGSLDRIPVLVASDEALAKIAPEQRQVLRLIDGLATFGDVLVSSRLGRFETYRLLASMLKRGTITVRSPSVTMDAVRADAAPPTTAPPSPRFEDPPPTRVSPTYTPPPPLSSSAPPSADTEYEEAFDLATEAYLRRDYDEAVGLYEACLLLRPGDARAEHNLRRVRALRESPSRG